MNELQREPDEIVPPNWETNLDGSDLGVTEERMEENPNSGEHTIDTEEERVIARVAQEAGILKRRPFELLFELLDRFFEQY
jgi:hypothetical protein